MIRFALVGAAALLPFAVTVAQATDAARPFVVPPTATSPVSGYLNLQGGIGFSNADGDHDNFGVFGGNAAVNYWRTPSNSIQLDLNTEMTTNLPNCCGDNRLYGSIGAHWSQRDPGHLIGVVGGISGTNGLDYYDFQAQAILGIDGQIYHGNWTFYGQAGVLRELIPVSGGSGDNGANMAFGRLVARVFTMPSAKWQFEIGYAAGHFTYDGDAARDVTWGIGYERQANPASPMSVFVDYSGASLRNPTDHLHVVDQELVGGIRLRMGPVISLIDQDRKGATVDLPNILLRSQAWNGWLY